MTTANRPLSPHLQIYKLPLAALMSISHRASGVLLSAGLVLLAYWLGAAGYGPEAFERAQRVMGSPFGIVVLLGFSAALYYHLCNGIRHLFWDAGWGFELERTRQANLVVLASAAALTAITWIVGLTQAF